MTPAEELTAAAAKLRALAITASTTVTGKPTARWHYKERTGLRSGYLYAENPDGPGERLITGGSSGPHGRGTHPGMRTRHGEYVAAMDPTVGLALADWLDSWISIDFNERAAMPEDLRHALAIARAINGEQR